jgi:hypothetical protein
MLVVLRPEAEQELLEAQAWYESKALGLGFEFARAADAAVASALRGKARGQVLQSRIQPNPAFERDAPKAARPSLLR